MKIPLFSLASKGDHNWIAYCHWKCRLHGKEMGQVRSLEHRVMAIIFVVNLFLHLFWNYLTPARDSERSDLKVWDVDALPMDFFFHIAKLSWTQQVHKIQCSNPFHPPSWSELCSFSLFALSQRVRAHVAVQSWASFMSLPATLLGSFFTAAFLILACKIRSSFLAAQMITIL